MAALISQFSGYVAISLLPPLAWLIFFLHEGRHPEPKRLVLYTFLGGALAAIAAAVVELSLLANASFSFQGILVAYFPIFAKAAFPAFLVIAFIEEYAKYAVVKFTVLKRKDFHEPVDAMIYMITAALGFAALENIMFLVPVLSAPDSLAYGVGLTANRFLGANLLHALASAIVGYFLARHHWSPYRKHAVAFGLLIATLLHAAFNSLIILRDAVPESLLLVVFLLVIMAVDVFMDFARLDREDHNHPAAGTKSSQSVAS